MLDSDLLDYLNYNRFKIASLLGPWLEFLSENFAEAIQNRRLQLPRKARLEDCTQIYWVEPANDVNFDYANQQSREKFSQCMEVNCKAFDGMRVLKLHDFWDRTDDNLVCNDRISKVGLMAYWKAMDASFQFNVKKRSDYMIRSKFRLLKAAPVEDKRLGQVMRPYHEDESSNEDKMPSFFAKHRKVQKNQRNDKYHWSKSSQSTRLFVTPS